MIISLCLFHIMQYVEQLEVEFRLQRCLKRLDVLMQSKQLLILGLLQKTGGGCTHKIILYDSATILKEKKSWVPTIL